ncbi:hypothetical protein [Caulobacter sp. LjRoot300]|uniref:hypothetical protein n=1 Tax=Caulobacter sp. LjRoot300 TaxID=3342321 RepID=UPI003ECC3ABA
MKNFAIAAVAAAALLGSASAALATPDGSYTIINYGSEAVALAANSLPSPTGFGPIAAGGGTTTGTAVTSSTVLSGTVIYTNPTGTAGCAYTTTVYLSSGKYNFSLTAAPYPAGATTTCNAVFGYKDTSLGWYSVNANMSGF